jgi:hypothetical protein
LLEAPIAGAREHRKGITVTKQLFAQGAQTLRSRTRGALDHLFCCLSLPFAPPKLSHPPPCQPQSSSSTYAPAHTHPTSNSSSSSSHQQHLCAHLQDSCQLTMPSPADKQHSPQFTCTGLASWTSSKDGLDLKCYGVTKRLKNAYVDLLEHSAGREGPAGPGVTLHQLSCWGSAVYQHEEADVSAAAAAPASIPTTPVLVP